MSKLDKNQRIETSKGTNTFDLGFDYLMTATTGQLRPVTHDLLQPGDRVTGKYDFFVRTMPMSTAAMTEIDFFVDYFFVPMDLLWLPFSAWWSQTKSYPFHRNSLNQGENFGSPLPALNELPKISYDDLLQYVLWEPTVTTHRTANYYDRVRLCEDLGMSGVAYGSASAVVDKTLVDDPVVPDFFPWQFLAYQAIYQHFYRDNEREPFNPLAYSCTSDANSTGGVFSFHYQSNLAEMHYLNRSDDYFTATKLSPLVANINNNPDFLGNFDLNLGQNRFVNQDAYEASVDDHSLSPLNLINDGNTFNENVDSPQSNRAINQLRALFAQEKLLHVMNMTHKNYDSQVLARLGYNVPKDVKHEIHHLGHDVTSLNIQEIVSGSNTFNGETGSYLGDIAGQGKALSRNFKGFKNFVAPCHGVLMTIFSCRTRPRYTTSALRKDMVSEITDFFTPELDDLGMQPQYLYETTMINEMRTSGTVNFNYKKPYAIVGWNYRYEYLKRNIDRASTAFMNPRDSKMIVSSGTPVDPPTITQGFNTYQQWAFVRTPLANASIAGGITPVPENDYYTRPHLDLYKVKPTELNNIMKVQWLYTPPYDSEAEEELEKWQDFPWLMYQRDPFLVDGHFSCKKISKMSIYSMPKLV